MAQVFTPCAGGVVKYPLPAGSGGTDCPSWVALKIDDFTLDVVPITGFALELSTNHQFVHSLNELIYVFSFGDRVGELTLSGLCFVGECPDANAGKISTLFSHYLNKRLATNLTPAKITLGDTGSSQLLGFLTGVRLEMPNPELPIVQWILRYSVIIDSASGAGGSGPGGLPGNPGGVTPEDFGRSPAAPGVPPSSTQGGATFGIGPANAGGVTPIDADPGGGPLEPGIPPAGTQGGFNLNSAFGGPPND